MPQQNGSKPQSEHRASVRQNEFHKIDDARKVTAAAPGCTRKRFILLHFIRESLSRYSYFIACRWTASINSTKKCSVCMQPTQQIVWRISFLPISVILNIEQIEIYNYLLYRKMVHWTKRLKLDRIQTSLRHKTFCFKRYFLCRNTKVHAAIQFD